MRNAGFTQSPSFLDYQLRMKKQHNRNNAQSIFGVHQIPSTSQIVNLPDPIAPETLYPIQAEAGDKLYTQGCLEPFKSIGDTLFVAHSLLYEWVADFTSTGEVRTFEKVRWNGKQRLTERYRYINQVPLRDSDDAMLVNWCEVTITNAKQEVVYRNA